MPSLELAWALSLPMCSSKRAPLRWLLEEGDAEKAKIKVKFKVRWMRESKEREREQEQEQEGALTSIGGCKTRWRPEP